MNPPETAPTGPVTRLLAIWPNCVPQSFAMQAWMFELESPKKPQSVWGAAAGAAAGVARAGPPAPSAEVAAGGTAAGGAPGAGTWARDSGYAARARTRSPATRV